MTRIMFVLFLAAAVAGCKPRPASKPAEAGGGATQKVFYVKGVVKEVFPAKKQISIEHEEIPNYMAAMTMTFDVKTAGDLKGLEPGDQVSFRMVVEEKDGWIEQLSKLTNAPNATPTPETFRRAKEVDPLNPGDLVPNYRFTNQLGHTVNLQDFKGQAVALTFIFTRCPFPTFCPRMTINFDEAQGQLQKRANGPTNWHLLTITFDPEYDTPAVLKKYASTYKADPAHWSFLTGDLIDITALAEQFGLTFWRPDPKQPAGINHNLRTVVLDTQGRVQKIFTQNAWKVEELVSEIVKAAETNVVPGQVSNPSTR